MIKKIFAAFLSFLITALSAGPQCASVFAQQVSARGVSGIRIPVGAVSLSPAGLGAKVVGAINPLRLRIPAPILQAHSAGAHAPKQGQPGEAKTPFQETLANLETPSLVEKISPEASGTEVRAAGSDDFSAKVFLTRHGRVPVEAELSSLGEALAEGPSFKEDLNRHGTIRVVLAKSQPGGGLAEADLDAIREVLSSHGVSAKLEVEKISVDWKREAEKVKTGEAHGPQADGWRRVLDEITYLPRTLAGSLTKPTAGEVVGGAVSKAPAFALSVGVWSATYSEHPAAMAAAIALSFSLDTFHGLWINSWNNLQNALQQERGLRYHTAFNFVYGQLWGAVFRVLAWSVLPNTVPPWSPTYWKDVGLSAVIGTFFGTLGSQGLNTLYNNGRLARWQRSAVQQVRDLGFMLAGTSFGAGSMKWFWAIFAAQQTLDLAIYLASRHSPSRPILYVASSAVAASAKFQGLYPVAAAGVAPESPLKQAFQGMLNSPYIKPFVWLAQKIRGLNAYLAFAWFQNRRSP